MVATYASLLYYMAAVSGMMMVKVRDDTMQSSIWKMQFGVLVNFAELLEFVISYT